MTRDLAAGAGAGEPGGLGESGAPQPPHKPEKSGERTQSAPPRSSRAAIVAAHLAMLGFAFLVSTSFTLGAAITHSLDPAVLNFARMGVATAILMSLLIAQTGKLAAPSGRAIIGYVWLAVLLCLFFVTMFIALRTTSSLATGAVFTLVPSMTALWSWLILRQTMSLYQSGALLIAVLAAVWVVFDGDMNRIKALHIGKGEAVYFVGCAAYAAYSPSVRALHAGRSLLEMTSWVMAFAVLLLGLYSWREILATDWQALPMSTYLGVAYLAVFTTSISFYLMQFATLHLPSAKVMAYTYLIPALVLAQNMVLGAPAPSTSVLIGVGVIASAVLLLQRSASWS